jgi:5-(carboxyamino)imidazole ribonucleotide synthase
MKPAVLPGVLTSDGRPATLGVMGGGQLGRMFVQAAQSLGFYTAVLDPDPASPAGRVAHFHIETDYLDEQGLAQLMQRSAAITTEFENVPAAALATLGAQRVVAPPARAVAVCQDRVAEKAQFQRSGVACAPHAVIASPADLDAVPAALLPGVLKTARLGYDGKGQQRVADRDALRQTWEQFGAVPCVLEAWLALEFEISVILARGASGQMVHLPVQRNLHRDGILALTEVPAPGLDPALAAQALHDAQRLVEALDYVGVLCVEFFVLKDGTLRANEMAPRPHNSGHYSIDACDVSQFDLQVRTLAGLPLVAPRQHSAAVMLNLLGDLWFDGQGRETAPPWAALLELPGVHLHLYGKLSPKRGRKMGHLTVTAAEPEQARRTARAVVQRLGLPADLLPGAVPGAWPDPTFDRPAQPA